MDLLSGHRAAPSGHALAVDPNPGSRTWRYWDIDPDHRIDYADENEYAEHFVEVFEEAVRCRLRSTKPVGIFLSGGMDSGSVASTAGRLLHNGERAPIPASGPTHGPSRSIPRPTSATSATRSRTTTTFQSLTSRPTLPGRSRAIPTRVPPDRDEPYVGIFRMLNDRTLSAAHAEGMGWMFTGGLGDVTVGEDVFDYLDTVAQGSMAEIVERTADARSVVGCPEA